MPDPSQAVADRRTPRRRVRGGSLRRFLPGLVVALCFGISLHRSGVDVVTVLHFLGLQAAAYALPGTLWWRLLRSGRDPGLTDVVMGTIAFHALSVPWYLLVRRVDLPHLVWALPVGAVVGAVILALRRGPGHPSTRRVPSWWAWHVAVAVCIGIVQVAGGLPVAAGDRVRWQGTDNPFLLSIAAEIKHHVPGRIPFVTGERLDYHWFTFADIASFSWLGGQELDVLTFSLMPLALLTTGLVGLAVLGWRFSGRPAGGVLVLWLAVLVGSAIPFGGFDGYIIDSTFLAIVWTGSVTQAYAEVLTVLLLFVVVDLLRTDRSRPVNLALFALVSFVIAGAKASFVPVLGAGALVALVVAIRRRRRWRTVLAMGVVLAAELAFAQIVLFGGASQGVRVGVRTSLSMIASTGGLTGLDDAELLVVLAFLVLAWSVPLMAVAGWWLGAGRRRTDDLASWWLLGMVVASMVVVLSTAHPGYSQYAFLRAALPFAYLGVAASLVLLWERAAPSTRTASLVAAGAGLGACLVLRSWSEPEPSSSLDALVVVLVTSVALVVLAAGVGALVARRGPRSLAALLVASSLGLGLGAARSVENVRALDDPRPGAADAGPAVIPTGGIEAARYVRAQSDPADMFATNAHCRPTAQEGICKNTAHWMSAWTERRAVVEGWGYTPTANSNGATIGEITTSPFWDPALLALNDEIFLRPSRSSLDALLARFPVRWLVVDRRFAADLQGLRRLLPDRRRFGETVVFHVGAEH